MTNSKFLIFFISVFILLSCSDNTEQAIKYNKKIVLSYQKVAEIKEKLIFYILSNDSIHFKQENKQFIEQIGLSEKEIKDIGSFHNYSDYNTAALEMMKTYRSVANKEIKELMSIIKGKSQIKDSDTLNTNNIFEKKLDEINKLIEKEFIKFEQAQEKFAVKFNIKMND